MPKSMPVNPEAANPLRRNTLAFVADYAFFGAGLAFAGTATTLPAFVARLTSSPLLIGMVGAVWNGGWLLPQIGAAHFLSTAPRKMPVAKLVSWLGRPAFLLPAVFLLLGGQRWPSAMLALLFACMFIFSAADAVVTVAWLDVFAKAIPAKQRGRVVGWGQLASGLLSLGAGALVRVLLSESGPGFPFDYSLILFLATLGFFASLGALYFIVEPVEPVPASRTALPEILPRLIELLRRDVAFRRANATRLLIGLSAMAMPFYAVFATYRLGLPESSIGYFLTAQMMGAALAGLAFGPVADRAGSHRVVQLMGASQLLASLLALASGFMPKASVAETTVLFALVFLLLGVGDGSIMLGAMNYVLEIAPPGDRASYVGLANTLAGLLVVYPLVGGWIATRFDYSAVFAVSATVITVGTLVALALPDPRRAGGSATVPSP